MDRSKKRKLLIALSLSLAAALVLAMSAVALAYSYGTVEQVDDHWNINVTAVDTAFEETYALGGASVWIKVYADGAEGWALDWSSDVPVTRVELNGGNFAVNYDPPRMDDTGLHDFRSPADQKYYWISQVTFWLEAGEETTTTAGDVEDTTTTAGEVQGTTTTAELTTVTEIQTGAGGSAGPGAGTWVLGILALALAGGLGWAAVRPARK